MPGMEFAMLSPKRRLLLFLLYSVLLIIPSVIVGYQICTLWPPANAKYALLKQAQRLIDSYYLGDLPVQIELERGMIRGMIAEIGDPYTVYIEPAAFEIREDMLAGEYGGIGAQLRMDESGQYRLYPFEESPASKAGIKNGDILIAVDRVPITAEMNQDEVLSLIRGVAGTDVVVELLNQEAPGEKIELVIERVIFSIPSVTHYLYTEDRRIAIIAITLFSEQTPQEVMQAYDELVALGAKAFIIDLRNNPGGMLDSAVAVSELFLREGTILYEEQKDETIIQYDVENPGKAQDAPLVVVVNEATASSAEVVAAAMQANGRALLLGRPTFGKGSVQSVLVLDDGSSLYITSARWLTPNQEILDQQGLQPDIFVPVDSGDGDSLLQTAVNYLQEELLGGM
jgi:carboxyl-terminal processing protease